MEPEIFTCKKCMQVKSDNCMAEWLEEALKCGIKLITQIMILSED